MTIDSRSKPLLVVVGGGSASGKSTFTKLVVAACQNLEILVLQQDHYYKDCSRLTEEEAKNYNFDHPDAVNFALLYSQLELLLQRKSIERPTYDFVTHGPTLANCHLESRDIIILEGLFVCYGERLRELADLMIYIEASDDVRVIRRVRRDQRERGRSIEATFEQYLQFVKPMHDRYVHPTRHAADLIVNWNTQNDRIVEAIAALLHERGKKK